MSVAVSTSAPAEFCDLPSNANALIWRILLLAASAQGTALLSWQGLLWSWEQAPTPSLLTAVALSLAPMLTPLMEQNLALDREFRFPEVA